MKILSNTGGVFATNAYLIADETTGKAVLFDAPNDTVEPLLEAAQKNGWDVQGLWLTHGHIDHIADHAVVTRRFPDAKLLIHPSDEPKLQRPKDMGFWGVETIGRSADGYLADGQRLAIGQIAVEVIHTPGHSPGHVMFYLPDSATLLGGDLILMGGVGRTDFPDSSYTALQESIRKLRPLPTGTKLLPGHGPASLLSDEFLTNPYLTDALNVQG